jgi:hypothetical protein
LHGYGETVAAEWVVALGSVVRMLELAIISGSLAVFQNQFLIQLA